MLDRRYLDNYLEFIHTTYNNSLTKEQTIANCTIGLIGELAEWEATPINTLEDLLEAGDVFYYLAILLEAVGSDCVVLQKAHPETETVSWVIQTLADRTKKLLYYNPPRYTEVEYREEVEKIAGVILGLLNFSYPTYEILTENTDKLTKRYHSPLSKE